MPEDDPASASTAAESAQDSAQDSVQPSGWVVQAGAAVASLAEAWLRDTVTTGVVLLSLGVILAGFSGANGGGWAALGTVVGLAGAVMALVPTIKRWRVSRVWLTLLIVAVVDVAVILLLVTR